MKKLTVLEELNVEGFEASRATFYCKIDSLKSLNDDESKYYAEDEDKRYYFGSNESFKITKLQMLSNKSFSYLTENLLENILEFSDGFQGGHNDEVNNICVLILNESMTKSILINPEGYKHSRYIALPNIHHIIDVFKILKIN